MTPDSLRKQANSFAQEVQDLLRRTLDGIGPDDVLIVRQREGGRSVTLRTDEEAPVVARVSGRPLLLDLKYRLQLSSDGSFLRTEQSSVQVRGMSKRSEPFFRYDYMAHPASANVPTSHLQVYGHRDDLLHALYVSDKARSQPSRKKDLDPASPRGLHMIHFPLGGMRFRPCLEDVLELIVKEFGIDTVDGWSDALVEGRIAWRHIQLASAIRDDPDAARNALDALGADS